MQPTGESSSSASLPNVCEVCVVGASKRAVNGVAKAMLDQAAALSRGTSVSARVVAEGEGEEALRGCGAYIVVGDADQSRLLVSNGSNDTAAMNSALEWILTASEERGSAGAILAIVGGRSKGFKAPSPPELWSKSGEEVLRKTGQQLALQLVDDGRSVSWVEAPTYAQVQAMARLLGVDAKEDAGAKHLLLPAALGVLLVAGLGLIGSAALRRRDGKNETGMPAGVQAGLGSLAVAAAVIAWARS